MFCFNGKTSTCIESIIKDEEDVKRILVALVITLQSSTSQTKSSSLHSCAQNIKRNQHLENETPQIWRNFTFRFKKPILRNLSMMTRTQEIYNDYSNIKKFNNFETFV